MRAPTQATAPKCFEGPPEAYEAGKPVLPLAYGVEWYRRFHAFLASTPQLSALHGLLGGDQSLGLAPSDLIRLHAKAIGFLHRSMDTGMRDTFAKVVSTFVRMNNSGWAEMQADPPELDGETLSRLNERGHVELSPISKVHADALRAKIDECGYVGARHIFDDARETPARSAEVLRNEMNLAHVRARDVLALPGLIDLARDPALVALANGHLGAPPILIDASAWRSFAGPNGPKEARDAQLFHFDLDCYRFCKVFIYLTDVDDGAGPHVFVPRTHRPDVMAGIAGDKGTPRRDEFESWYFGATRKDAAEVRGRIGIDPVAITGSRGSRFVANTEAIHRGKPPADRDRIVLQLVYGIAPSTAWSKPFEPVRPVDAEGRPIAKLRGSASYVMRLFYPNLL